MHCHRITDHDDSTFITAIAAIRNSHEANERAPDYTAIAIAAMAASIPPPERGRAGWGLTGGASCTGLCRRHRHQPPPRSSPLPGEDAIAPSRLPGDLPAAKPPQKR